MQLQTETKPASPQLKAMKRAVSYRRVSTDEQASNYSLSSQKKEIQTYAARNGMEIVADFVDDYTGSSLERPGLEQARKWVRQRRADCVICLDSDRLTRHPTHYMILRDELMDLGIELHYTRRGKVNLDDSMSMLIEDFYGRKNEQWKKDIIEATTRGRREKVRQGNVITHGTPPYGYREVKEGDKTRLEIYEPEAAIVRRIFNLYVYEEKGYNLITQELTAADVPTRADIGLRNLDKKKGRCEWSTASIQRIIKRETYTGKWYYAKGSDEPILVKVPSIVPREVWLIAQQKRKSNRGRRLAAKYEYLLSGRGKCAYCSSPVSGNSNVWKSKNSSGVILYYRCNAASQNGKVGVTCNAPYFRADKIDRVVWNWIKDMVLKPESLEAGLRNYQQEQASQAGPLQEELARIEKLITKRQNRLNRLLELYLDGEFPKDEYVIAKRQIEVDLTELEAQQAEKINQLGAVTLAPERIADIHEFARKIRAGLDAVSSEESFETRRKIVNLLDVKIKMAVEDGQKIVYTTCILNINAPQELPFDYTSSGTSRWID
ncbi:MAG: recombinase family protein [Anaerolineae bacterium]|nr:recombinase family protein [Anaerolineae bacterium]